MGTVLHDNVLPAAYRTDNKTEANNDPNNEDQNSASYNSSSGAAGSGSGGNILTKGGVLKQTNSRILLNERALLAAKAEEAEYNRYMKEKKRAEQREQEEREEQQRAFERQQQQQHQGQTSSSSSTLTSALVSSSTTTTTNTTNTTVQSIDRNQSSDSSSMRSERYASQVMAASPIGRFVSPLWSQYDSDEEDEMIRQSLMQEEDGQAQANMEANKQLSDRSTCGGVVINNPMLTQNNVHENTIRNSFTKSSIIQLFRKPTTNTTVSEDEDGKPSSYKSSGSDISAGRGSDKFVRFGNHQTRLISRNSEHDNRTSSAEVDVELNSQL